MVGRFHFQKPSLSQHNFPLQRERNRNLPSNVLNSKSWQCPLLRGSESWSSGRDFSLPTSHHHLYSSPRNKYCGTHQVFLKKISGHVHSRSLSITVRTWKAWISSYPQMFPLSKPRSHRILVLFFRTTQGLEARVIFSFFNNLDRLPY